MQDILKQTMDELNIDENKEKFNLDPEEVVGEILEELEPEEEEAIEEDELEEEEEFDEDDLVFDIEEDEEEDEEDEEEYEDEEEPEEEPFKRKPTREEKQRYAFEKLRKENKEKENKLKELDTIAQTYGYRDHNEMVERLKQDALEKEAQKRGIDPNIYKEMDEYKRKIEQLEESQRNERERTKINMFINRVDSFASKYDLSQDTKNKLITKLDEDGFTVDTLLQIKNYDKMFLGYVNEDVAEAKRQKKLELEARKRKIQEEKFKNQGNDSEFSLEDLIDKMVKTSRT